MWRTNPRRSRGAWRMVTTTPMELWHGNHNPDGIALRCRSQPTPGGIAVWGSQPRRITTMHGDHKPGGVAKCEQKQNKMELP